MTNLEIDYDKTDRRCTVTVSFDTTDQLDKPGLQANVIEHHLLTQDLARAVGAVAASLLTHAPTAITSNVEANPEADDS